MTSDQNPGEKPRPCPPWCTNTDPSHSVAGGVRVHAAEAVTIGQLTGVQVTLMQAEVFGDTDDPTVNLAALSKPRPNAGPQVVRLALTDAVALADILDALDVDRPGAVDQLSAALRAEAALATDKKTDQ